MRKYLRLSLGLLLGGVILQGGNSLAAPAGTLVSNQAEMDATGGTINVTDERAIVLMRESIVYNGPVSITASGLPPEIDNYPGSPTSATSKYTHGHHAVLSIHNAENFTFGTTTLNYGTSSVPINTTMRDAIGVRMEMYGTLGTSHNASFGANSVFNVYANIQGSDSNGARAFEIFAAGNDSAKQEGKGNIVTFGENAQINVENSGVGSAEGMEVYSSTVKFLGDTKINVKASGEKTDANVVVSYGIYTRADSHIDVAGTLDIVSESEYAAFGMQFMNESTFRADKLKVQAISNYVVPEGKAEPLVVGVFANRDSNFTFGESEVTVTRNGVDGDGRALWAANGGEISALEAKHLITGNIIAQQKYKDTSSAFVYEPLGTTKINVDFGADSVFTGYAQKQDEAIINLNMLGTTKWDMVDDSVITTLDFQNDSSKVNFIKSDGFSTLTTDVLAGTSGNFFMRTDIQALQGDLLVAKDTGTHGGIHKITVANNGSAAVTGDERLMIVDTTTGNGIFELTNVVELGGYQYDIRQVPEDQMDWELAAKRGLESDKTPSKSAEAVQLFSGAYLLNYAENQTLIKRLGDLRKNDFLQEGEKDRERAVWARVFGGEFTSSSDGFLHGFDMDYWGVQAGYDKRIDRDDKKGVVYVGGFLGYSKGNMDYLNSGSGSIDSKSLGAYWTHIHRNGFYADAVFKYNWMNSDFKTLDSAGLGVKGDDINTRGFTASLELGRRYFFDKTDDNGEKIKVENREGWYVEPQVQLTLGHQNGGRFTLSNGLQIKSDSFRSVLGRAEVHLGYEVKHGKNPVNVYGKLGVMKEFDGDVDYYLNGSPENTSYGDTWKLWGVGVTAQFSQKHNLYLEVERATGGQFNQNWGVNGGYRFQW